MDIALASIDGIEFLLRWGHFLAGVAWIGMLWYFNFVQGPWFGEAEASVKNAAIQKLVPRALWYFRYGALFTWLTGVGILAIRGHKGGLEVFTTSWGITILTGALMGTFMFLNVWLIIWPAQKVVIASANQVASGGQAIPDAAARGAKAGLASRHNTLFSIPLLFMMGAASHLSLNISYDYNGWLLAGVLGLLLGLIELNAIKGKLGPITTVKGVIHMGFLLTAVLYVIIEVLT